MTLVFETREIGSDFIETIWQARSTDAGTFTSSAFSNWEIVLITVEGKRMIAVRGPETKATLADYPADAEFFGITFRLGAFMPQFPIKILLDRQDRLLPAASDTSFWLHGSAWELPSFENADVFVNRLIRQEILVRDPIVEAALHGRTPAISIRSLQYRFVQATGLTHKTIQQIERAHAAVALLKHGTPIGDAVFELGYFDQSHLTNALKRFIGTTPAQITPDNQ